MTIQNSNHVCVPCRYVARQTYKCTHCGSDMVHTGKNWRAPKKNNDRAWKRIERGEWLWDREAVAKSQNQTANRLRAFLERRKRINKKHGQSLLSRTRRPS